MSGFNSQNNKNNLNIYKNSDELTLCSVFVKEFKIGLRPFYNYVKNGKLHSRLMGLFMAIKKLDQNSPVCGKNVGEGLKTIKGKLLLRGFVFTPKAGIRQRFGNPKINEDDFSLLWKDFDPSSARFPKSATHLELHYMILAYSSEKNLFTSYNTSSIRRSKKDKTERLELLPEARIAKKNGVQYILAIGLRFMEILRDEEYELLGQDAVGLEILEVFDC